MNAERKPPSFVPRALVTVAVVAARTFTPAWSQTTFTEHVLATNAPQPTSVVAADVDGDGDNDVVAAEYSADLVTWYENNGASPPRTSTVTATSTGSEA